MRNFNENTKKNVNCEHMKGDAIRYLNKETPISANLSVNSPVIFLKFMYSSSKCSYKVIFVSPILSAILFKYLIASPFICSQFTFFFVFSLKFRIYIIQNIIFNSFLLLKSLFVYFNNKNTRIFYFE